MRGCSLAYCSELPRNMLTPKSLWRFVMQTHRGKSSSGTEVPLDSLINRRAVYVVAAGLVASLITLTAAAQQAPISADNAAPELQEIVVTGSMIQRGNAETAEAV